MNSKQSIEEAAEDYAAYEVPAKDPYYYEVNAFRAGALSDAAKKYWFEQFKAQEQKPVGKASEAIQELKNLTGGHWDKFNTNDEINAELGREQPLTDAAIEASIIKSAKISKRGDKTFVKIELELPEHIIDAEINGLAEKEYPLSVPNRISLIRAFIKGFKAALKPDGNPNLIDALTKINQMSDCGSPEATIIRMKEIASEALKLISF